MNTENNFRRLLALLFLTLAMGLALYALPDELFGLRIRKVDMLSDIRVQPEKASVIDSLKQLLAQPDTFGTVVPVAHDSVRAVTVADQAALVKRDSLYRLLYAENGEAQGGKRIEDFSPGHIALKRFFNALDNLNSLGRPVRIAFMGDSFIEGDIIVADFRSGLQKKFGGRGVGFVPVTSVSSQYRPTIEQHAEGWKSYSLLHDDGFRYTLPAAVFEAEGGRASLTLKATNRYPELVSASSVKLIYEQNKSTTMQLVLNEGADTIRRQLPPASVITQNIQEGELTKAEYIFEQTDDFRALGAAMEDEKGVVVDNFSLRGNSGLILEQLDSTKCAEFTKIRPYDLIILQYGLNVVSEDMLDYGWYGARMSNVIGYLRKCFPDSDILLVSVSDRSRQLDGKFETMPEILAMLHTQRQAARRTGIAFWNLYDAMGGENSMVGFVEKGWAGKDYTHLSFRGGREIANGLIDALLSEKEFYDNAEKALH